MQNSVKILPWKIKSIETGSYDLSIGVIGFEARSRAIFERFRIAAEKRIAAAFPDRRTLSFGENHEWYRRSGYGVLDVGDREFGDVMSDALSSLAGKLAQPRVLVDISSMSRLRLACLISVLLAGSWPRGVIVEFVYCIAQYSDPPTASEPNTHAGPVLPEFAGWTSNPEFPPSVLVGVGYELDKALGAVELLEPADVWVFSPISNDDRYTPAVKSANVGLWNIVPEDRVLRYRVDQPFQTFVSLEGLVSRQMRHHRPVVMPFGPKVFSLCALLVAAVHPTVAVWRVSSGGLEAAIDRKPSEVVVGLRVEVNQAVSEIREQ